MIIVFMYYFVISPINFNLYPYPERNNFYLILIKYMIHAGSSHEWICVLIILKFNRLMVESSSVGLHPLCGPDFIRLKNL